MICVKQNRRVRRNFFNKVFFNKVTSSACRNTEHEVKNKREQHVMETLISNYFLRERAFYHLNERFVSNVTGDMIFSTRSLERF